MGSIPTPQFFNVINGETRSAASFHQVTDPRTEEPLWDAPVATPEDLEEAINAAQKAFKTWGKTTIPQRKEALLKMVDVINENSPELIEYTRKETGKSVRSLLRTCCKGLSSLLTPCCREGVDGSDRNW